MQKLSYSQFGEDITAMHLLRNVRSGFYVDVGAHHPLRHSNTALMHINGWNGVNVEPMDSGIRAFRRFRPHATNVRAAVHNEADMVTLYKFEKGLTNTTLPSRADQLRDNKQFKGEEQVAALSMNAIFERHVPDNRQVNYLSVDIEGYDTEAVLALDLDTHHPDVVCLELHRPDMMALGEDAAVRHMFEHGYQLYAVNVFSFTFVDVRAAEGHLDIPRVARLRESTLTAAAARDRA